MARKIDAWLAHLSDPAGLNRKWPAMPFAPGEAHLLQTLIEEAGRHNVRPALVRNLSTLFRADPGAVMRGDPAVVRDLVTPLLAQANDQRVLDVARTSMLAVIARDILHAAAAEGLPVALIKGLDFAEAAYGGLHNRAFTDVDLLIQPKAEPALGAILTRSGFTAHEPEGKRADMAERKWTKSNAHGNQILVELHTDLVHVRELQKQMSLTYDLYAGPANGGVTPAARLVVAALHGAVSHLFGRLQYVVDALMIARTGVDAAELRERAERAGALLPLLTSLRLASDIYGCAQCDALLGALGPFRWQGLEQHLITASMVLSAKSPWRWRLLPQRYAYGRILQWS